MIEDIFPEELNINIHRLANLASVPEFGRKKGLDADQIKEIIEFIGTSFTANFLDQPFQDKSLIYPTPFSPGRFSDGSWPVYYAAMDQATAQSEVLHHYGKHAVGDTGERDAFYSVVVTEFKGSISNLRTRAAEWPQLCAEDYTFCQSLGKEAVQRLLDAFQSPSARKVDGVTVPVFQRKAISNPKINGTVRLSFNGETRVISIAVTGS